MQLERGQVAVITGAASGIGLAVATELARAGLDIVVSDIDAEAVETAVRQLQAHGVSALAAVTDVSDPEAVQAVADRAIERFGRIDVVINNAGVAAAFGGLWEVPVTELRWLLDVDLLGVLYGLRAFVPHLVQQGRGHVVNTASLAATSVIPFNGPYNAAKTAVLAASLTLRAELAQVAPEVGVSVLVPGVIRTRIRESARLRPHEAPPPAAHMPPRPDESDAIGPEVVGPMVLDAIRANRFMIATQASVAEAARRHFTALIAEFD